MSLVAALRYRGKIYPGYNSHAKAYNALLLEHPDFDIPLDKIVLEEIPREIIEYGYTDIATTSLFYTRQERLAFNN